MRRCGLVRSGAAGGWAGRVAVADPARSALQLANSETGVMQDLPPGWPSGPDAGLRQAALRLRLAGLRRWGWSAHKLGGPKGIGALVIRRGLDVEAQLRGGGQEMGRRAGTENLIGIAGFGAAAEAAARDLADGVWDASQNLEIF
jgi:cysteine desulfurase